MGQSGSTAQQPLTLQYMYMYVVEQLHLKLASPGISVIDSCVTPTDISIYMPSICQNFLSMFGYAGVFWCKLCELDLFFSFAKNYARLNCISFANNISRALV